MAWGCTAKQNGSKRWLRTRFGLKVCWIFLFVRAEALSAILKRLRKTQMRIFVFYACSKQKIATEYPERVMLEEHSGKPNCAHKITGC